MFFFFKKTRLDSTRLDSIRPDSTRLDPTRPDPTRLDSIRPRLGMTLAPPKALIFPHPYRYTTSESGELPFSDYEYLDAQTQPAQFGLLSDKLKSMDTAFFLTKARERKSYLFQVEIEYDLNLAKSVGIDFSGFPELRKPTVEEVSALQRREFIASNRNIGRQAPKLISDCRQSVVTDHVDNLLYLLIWFSARIVSVRCCVQFNTFPFLTGFCQHIAQQRAASVSKITKDWAKSVTNSLAGGRGFFLEKIGKIICQAFAKNRGYTKA